MGQEEISRSACAARQADHSTEIYWFAGSAAAVAAVAMYFE
jgi:hypothetical protein